MEDFFTTDNWTLKLVTLLVSCAILLVGIIALVKKSRPNEETVEKSKTAVVTESEDVNIRQTPGSSAKVDGSKNVDIQQ
ncbi:MAG: hypothetical protein AB8F78_09110 [Saprospiraceae bacterium]